jgi:hypothetical protein
LSVIEIQEGDKLQSDGGIYEWVVKRDYFDQPKLVLLPFDEKKHLKKMKEDDY